MMKVMAKGQHGLSFSGFMVVVVIIVFAAIVGMRFIPAYIEDAKIKSIFDDITRDPEMRNASVKDIRNSFSRRASMDDITAIKDSDIEVVKDGGISLSASYVVKAPLFGNASLLLEFSPSSSSK